jgi:hypothetical protein
LREQVGRLIGLFGVLTNKTCTRLCRVHFCFLDRQAGAPGGREVKYRVWNNDLRPLVVRTDQFSVMVHFAAL